MKVTEHIEHLLRQGRKPKELVELGFPKQVITRVRRQLEVEKTASQMRTQEGKVQAVVARPAETETSQANPGGTGDQSPAVGESSGGSGITGSRAGGSGNSH